MVEKTEGAAAPVVTGVLLRIVIVLELIAVLAVMIPAVPLATGMTLPQDVMDAGTIAAPVSVWISIVCLVVLMFWCYRTNVALEDRVHHELQTSPPMAAFWFIVPIAGFWKPYGVVREIYKASRNPNAWPEDRQASIVGWWWGLRMLSSLTGTIVSFSEKSGAAESSVQVVLAIVLFVALVIQLPLLFLIVSRVMTWLKAPAKAVAADVF